MFDRRLQILLDGERSARLAQSARDRNLSVSAAIREAIDLAYPPDAGTRRASAELILAALPLSVLEPDKLRAELDELRVAAVPHAAPGTPGHDRVRRPAGQCGH